MASRAIHHVLLGSALLCAAALLCLGRAAPGVAQDVPPTPAIVSNFPVASDARLAGDAKQTRFVLDLDKPIQHRAFVRTDPDQVVIDIPQVAFRLPAGVGTAGRGLVKAFRYGLVMPGGSRIVMDLAGPAKIANSYLLDGANGQPPRLVLELVETDRASMERLPLRPAVAEANAAVAAPATVPAAPKPADPRPVVVIDPGHGGPDNGTQSNGEMEKNLVLAFALALRDRLEKVGKYRVVMTRIDDTFIPLDDRVKVARSQSAALFVSIHADALPRREGSPEVRRLPGAEGARCALSAGRTRLCLQQGRSRTSGVGILALPHGRLNGTGDRCFSGQTADNGGIEQLKRGFRVAKALVWPQRQPYKKVPSGQRNRSDFPAGPANMGAYCEPPRTSDRVLDGRRQQRR